MKQKHEKIVMLTAYDFPSGRFVEAAKADIILVGDSLGMVVLGYDDTLQVTMQDMISHTQAVRRGAKEAFIVADMPFQSYHISIEESKRNALQLIVQGKANAVKLEGGSENRLNTIREIVDCEIPVVAHLGLTPQSIHALGGYVVQGKKKNDYEKIFKQAVDVEKAGAFMLVLEGIPELLGSEISKELKIPTIGIGAGRYTDGQVLVYHDVLGAYDFKPKFVKHYLNSKEIIPQALQTFAKEVKSGEFPQPEHIYYPIKDEEK